MKRHIAVDVTGLLLAVVVTAASIQDRDAGHRLLAILRGTFSTIRLVWADGGYPGRLLGWANSLLALRVDIIKPKPGSTGFHVRPRVWVVEWTFRLAQQISPLCPRLRGQARTPRSDGSRRHHRDHDQATRPNLTVLNHTLSEGTTSRRTIRSFIQWRHRTGIAARFTIRYRTARTTPLAASTTRLELIRTTIEADHITLSTRIAALLLLLYGIPVRRIAELTLENITTTPPGPTVRIGTLPAPLPEPLLPLLQQHLDSHANQKTTNHESRWLFPGTRAGHHLTEKTLMQRLRKLGIDIRAARNAALHDLSKEIDAASLAALLGYTPNTMNIHAARAAIPMGSYPAIKHPKR